MIKLTGLKSFLPKAIGMARGLRKEFVVGLDLGSSSFKFVQFMNREGKTVLVKAAIRKLTPSQDPSTWERERLSALKELFEGLEIKSSRFIVSVNDEHTASKVVITPPMPRGELEEAIRFESKNYFPFSIDEASLDFESLGETREKGMRKQRVLVGVSPRKTVSGTLDLLRKVGIKPPSLIPFSAALEKLGRHSTWREDQTHGLVDMGERFSEVAIFKGRELVFSRKISIAGRDFTTAMTGMLASDRGKIALSWDEAEKIKQEVGIPSGEDARMIDEKLSAIQIASLLRSPLEQLVDEIDRCFHYYREESGGGKVDQLLLLGRAANLRGLSSRLSEELGIEVLISDPLAWIRLDPQVVRPEEGFGAFGGALGAALSEGKGINVLPPEMKDELQRTVKRTTVETAAVSLILLLAFLYIGMRLQLANFEKRIAVAKLQMESFGYGLGKVARQHLAQELLADEPYWEEVFKELGNLIPPNVYLTSLESRDKKIYLKGGVTAEDKESVLSGFILGLEQGIFKNVKLVHARETSDQSTSEFQLECWVE